MTAEQKEPLHFYSTREKPYGVFSNFSAHPFELDGLEWPTSEHYFQAQKYAGTPYFERVRQAKTPGEAARLGRSRDYPIRPDWEEVKDDIMRKAVTRKFETYPELKEILLSTGNRHLIENTSDDYYWGCGTRGTGQNKLGQILMEVRNLFRQSQQG